MPSRADPGYQRLSAPGASALVHPPAAAVIADMLARAPLHALAREHPAAEMLGGRGAAWRIAAPDGQGSWVVRHGLRGGAVMGPLLRDRYLRIGEPRPFAEARVSLVARERGVRTPRVIAAVSYPDGAFRRADVVTEFLDGPTLAETLFRGRAQQGGVTRLDGDPEVEGDAQGGAAPQGGDERRKALARAGRLVRELARAGVEHADLNAGNILLRPGREGTEAWVLDLDRARLHPEPAVSAGVRMLARLRRSLRKLESDRALVASSGPAEGAVFARPEWAALAEGAGDLLDLLRAEGPA